MLNMLLKQQSTCEVLSSVNLSASQLSERTRLYTRKLSIFNYLVIRFCFVRKKMADASNEKTECKDNRKAAPHKKARYNGLEKKRRWDFRNREEMSEEKRACFRPEDRVKKRKFLLLLGYNGANYSGMQRNPEVNTIEEELLSAMLKHKWIIDEGFKQPQMVHFQRAARTDKGVSAARQCISLKLRE